MNVFSLTDSALSARARTALGRRIGAIAGRDRPPGQVMVKLIGGRRSREAVAATANYIARESGRFQGVKDRPPLFDESGDSVERVRGIGARWDLAHDDENLSKEARRIAAAEGLEAIARLSDRERLAHVQAWHLVVSVAAGDDDRKEVTARLCEATAMAVMELFGQAGRPALWTVHEDGREPHAHILVRSLDAFGNRLRFDRRGDWADSFKDVVVRHCRSMGINATAERREDRSDVRRRILDGQEALRTNRKAVEIKAGPRDLALQTPMWFLHEGQGWAARRERLVELKDEAGRRKREEGARFAEALAEQLPPGAKRKAPEEVPPDLRPIFEEMAPAFVDPLAALESFWRMATEGATRSENGLRTPRRALALWYLRHQPIAFGEITRDAAELGRNAELVKVVRAARLPLPVSKEIRRADAHEGAMRAREDLVRLRRRAASRRDRALMVGSLDRLADMVQGRFLSEDRARSIRRIVEDLRVPEPVLGRAAPDGTAGVGILGRLSGLLRGGSVGRTNQPADGRSPTGGNRRDRGGGKTRD